MKQLAGISSLGALLSEPCRKLNRLDVIHSDSTHTTKKTKLLTFLQILIITSSVPDVCQEIGE